MRRYWRRYAGFARCAMLRRLEYRSAVLVGILTSAMGLIATLFLWNVLFQEQSTINGYGWNDMIAYAMIVFLCNATLAFSTERRISDGVLDGSIAADLCKPLRHQDLCLFEAMGSALIEFALAAVIGVAVAACLCDLSAFANASSVLLLAASLVLAFLLKFCIAYIAGLMCFYTSNGYGVIFLRQVITDVFSGAMLPLSFYPLWFQRVAGVLPFQAVVYTPTQLFLGRLTGPDAIGALALQALWIVALWFGAQLLFRAAVRKITIQGG